MTNPVSIPMAYGGDLDIDIHQKKASIEENQGEMMAFSIQTGNQNAAEIMKQKEEA